MNNQYLLLQPTEYVDDIVTRIDKSSSRIYMMALVISEDDTTRGIIDALVRASKRGVDVNLGMDLYFTYRELGLNASRWQYFKARVQSMRATKKRLEKSGAKVRWLGQFGVTLFSRRTHIKWSIVDDTVYSFGGVNLYQEGIAATDYFFRTQDAELASLMVAEHKRVVSSDRVGHSYKSHGIPHYENTVLIDGGRLNDSIIYDRACHYTALATSVTYVSQYCPSGKLGQLLKKKNAKIYFNPWRQAPDRFNRMLIRWNSWLNGINTLYTRENYLHAKFMLFTMPDGRTVALTGSHNFVAAGAILGTREVALETTNPAIVRQLRHFLNTYIS